MSARSQRQTPAVKFLVLGIGLLVVLVTGFYFFHQSGGNQAYKAAGTAVKNGAPAIVKTQDFEDWRLECRGAAENCYIFQQHARNDSKALALRVVVISAKDKNGAAMPLMRVMTPLGVHLPAGITMQIDGQKPVKLPYEFCGPGGCRVDFGMGGEFMAAMQTGQVLHVNYGVADGKTAQVNVSLKGFVSALAALSPGQPQPAPQQPPAQQ